MLWMVVNSLAMYNSKCLTSCFYLFLSPASGDIGLHLSDKFLQWIWSQGRCYCISSQTVIRLLCPLKAFFITSTHNILTLDIANWWLSLLSCCLSFPCSFSWRLASSCNDFHERLNDIIQLDHIEGQHACSGLCFRSSDWPIDLTVCLSICLTHIHISAFGSGIWIGLGNFQIRGIAISVEDVRIWSSHLNKGCIPVLVYIVWSRSWSIVWSEIVLWNCSICISETRMLSHSLLMYDMYKNCLQNCQGYHAYVCDAFHHLRFLTQQYECQVLCDHIWSSNSCTVLICSWASDALYCTAIRNSRRHVCNFLWQTIVMSWQPLRVTYRLVVLSIEQRLELRLLLIIL